MLDGPLFPRDQPRHLPTLVSAWLLAMPTGYATVCAGSALLGAVVVMGPTFPLQELAFLAIPLVALGSVLLGALYAILSWSPRLRPAVFVWTELVLFCVLPIWGLVLDAGLPNCGVTCAEQYRPVEWPGVMVVYGAYGIGVLAWAVARIRPRPLGTTLEICVLAALSIGAFSTTALTIQFGPQALAGVVFGPIGLPLIAPALVSVAFAAMVGVRIWRVGRLEIGAAAGAVTGLTVGLDLLVNRVVLGVWGLWGGALGNTCGWTLSTLTPPPADCHYLCTVAAQGHPWLVRPLRLGQRRGRTIVVNRQLAVANAFEDLLHERWPTMGRVARATYDRLGRPISHHITSPWLADAIWLGMLPAQSLFELTLLLADPGEPEDRIDRMYR
jgi:hypothetical protein